MAQCEKPENSQSATAAACLHAFSKRCIPLRSPKYDHDWSCQIFKPHSESDLAVSPWATSSKLLPTTTQ